MATEKSFKTFIYAAIGSGLGLGLSPYFPGTCGALIGVGFHIIIVRWLPIQSHLFALLLVFLGVCITHILLTPWAQEFWNDSDPKNFVLDEIAGYLLVPIIFRPVQSWKTILLGFLIFRIFDIFKLIPPAKYIDTNFHGAWGVILDDLVSAGYAALVLYGIYILQPEWIKP